ncbi:hypothetical protein P7K49_038318 [Saguinus oedipus]|uniref:Androgen receptor n=1 Tax=Saguinus oedipus TaxID=9490 RepID=A0ABQ9TEB4_SAGOE|nr:hypothetical protein P7K49_038318 [Saguinus oedipus]
MEAAAAAAAAAGGGCSSGPPPLLLSEGEQQCYSELFARCAGAAGGGPGPGPPEAARVAPGTVTAAAGPVADLFRASQLPAETLHQSVCGGGGCEWGGIGQFSERALQPGMAATPLSLGDTSLLRSSAPRPVLAVQT